MVRNNKIYVVQESDVSFKNKRIAHLTSAHPRYDIRVFLKECQSLSLHGFDVSLVVADGCGNEVSNGVKIFDVGCSKGRLNRMLYVPHLVFLKAVELDADIYHIHDPELLPIGMKLKRLGKKVLFDSHEDVPKQILSKHYLHPILRKLISKAYTFYESYTCSRFDGVVVATPFIRDKFKSINPKTIDVNNFPIISEFEDSQECEKNIYEVCYVGTIAQVRGVLELVAAMTLTNSEVRLNMVGAFAEKTIQERVSLQPGWEKVNYLGVQDRQGVGAVLGRSVAGLVNLHPLINYLDALPIKMFEYMSAGIPVIASDFPLWRDILEDNECGICVNPLDPQEIANAINYLVSHPGEAKIMGENGRRAILEKFNWSIEEKKLIQFYEEVLKDKLIKE
jgi:glycosyltransferase involved in cell wall biosynthesis